MRSWFRAARSSAFTIQTSVATARSLDARKRRGGSRPAAVTVGASDLSMDFDDYAAIIRHPDRWTLVFVEPLEWLLPPLKERLMTWGAREDQVHIINAAVCNSSASSLKLHTIAVAAIDEYNLTVIKRELSHLSSLDRGLVKKGIRDSAIIPTHLKPVLERRLKAVPVPCITPAELLKATQVAPEDIEFLAVDAEGFDLAVLRPFMAMEGFAPSVASYEWINMERKWADFMAVTQELATRGYDIRQEYFDFKLVSRRYL